MTGATKPGAKPGDKNGTKPATRSRTKADTSAGLNSDWIEQLAASPVPDMESGQAAPVDAAGLEQLAALFITPDGSEDAGAGATAASTPPASPAQFNVHDCALDLSTLIEASAGTGKTWNISGLYLRLLLEKELTVDQILVVTFTKAATAELRERIRSRIVDMLDSLRQPGPAADDFLHKLAERLMQALGKPRDDLVNRLELALQSFDEAAIFTIHSFCQRALSETPFAAGMPFATEITQDDSRELREAVNDFWRRHVDGGNLDAGFTRFLLDCKDKPEKYLKLLRRHVSKPKANFIWPQDRQVDPPAVRARMLALFEPARQTWLAQAAAIRELLAGASLLASHKREVLEAAYQHCDAYFACAEPGPWPAKINPLRATKMAGAARAKQVAPVHAFFDHVEALASGLKALQAELEQACQLQRLRLIRTLLEEGQQGLARAKRDKRILSYDDLLVNLYQALEKDGGSILAQALRQRYPVALIDEFQDTDPLQFSIFHNIYGNADASLFLVGDPKQAIYSFRNADLHTYMQARQAVKLTCTLGSNQRSSQGLIAALNTLFGTNQQAFMLPGLSYHPVGLGAKKRLPFIDNTCPPSDLEVWMLPHEEGSMLQRSEAIERATLATASEIARLVRCGAAGDIMLDARPLAPGDIAVLVRSHAQAAKIRAALAACGVSSIEISQASVFESGDAADVETVLRAVLDPARQGLVLAALATPLMGKSAAELDRIAADENRLAELSERFMQYRDTWCRQGLAIMYRQFMENEDVSSRMLCRADGERRMTNLRHLGEALQQAQQQSLTPESALQWLQSQRQAESAGEAAQLRLESDRDLVQILTIHKSKGLEFPVVFCPYLCDGRPPVIGGMDGREYHEDDGRLVIDFSCDKEAVERAKKKMRAESNAETLRLIYVALTRASHRCYVVAGTYTTGSKGNTDQGASCMLNWLVDSSGTPADDWYAQPPGAAQVRQSWEALATACPHVNLRPLLDIDLRHTAQASSRLLALAPRLSSVNLKEDWRASSFSGLARGMGDSVAADHDAHASIVTPMLRPSQPPTGLPRDDILLFPRGSQAGECMHAAFEQADFSKPDTWPDAVAQALALFPQPAAKVDGRIARAMLTNVLADVLATDLGHGLQLASLGRKRRMAEMEFNFLAQGLRANDLNALLHASPYKLPPLAFTNLDGYLKGFIDLVFEHDGKYWLLDWKSNHLGYEPADYGQAQLQAAMAEHGYYLQYLLYTVALDRYLALRLPDYDYDRHFGGVYYLFVRGVRPGWQQAGWNPARPARPGVFFDRPERAFVQALERLLGAAATEAA